MVLVIPLAQGQHDTCKVSPQLPVEAVPFFEQAMNGCKSRSSTKFNVRFLYLPPRSGVRSARVRRIDLIIWHVSTGCIHSTCAIRCQSFRHLRGSNHCGIFSCLPLSDDELIFLSLKHAPCFESKPSGWSCLFCLQEP